ncbi:MAG TPA: DUF4013 domain-containing protein [Candidatus Dojkabacteria bacterium]|nr:DUF4013 domain-containing protein [Candidatus Dojkabacteria bacterium]
MINIDNAINYPFKDKNWKESLGVYFLIVFVMGIVSQMISFFLGLSSAFIRSLQHYSGTPYSQLSNSATSFLVSLLLLPITLYLAGYVIDLTRNVMKGNEDTHVKHGKIGDRIQTGLAPFTYGLVLTLTDVLLLLLVFTPTVIATYLQDHYPMLAVIVLICFAILCILFVLFSVFLLPVIYKTMLYIYINEGSISKGFNASKIFEILKTSWKKFYFLYFVDIVIAFISFISILSCCLVFIVSPILTSILIFIKADIEGNVFRQINDGDAPVKKAKVVRKVVAKKVTKK